MEINKELIRDYLNYLNTDNDEYKYTEWNIHNFDIKYNRIFIQITVYFAYGSYTLDALDYNEWLRNKKVGELLNGN